MRSYNYLRVEINELLPDGVPKTRISPYDLILSVAIFQS